MFRPPEVVSAPRGLVSRAFHLLTTPFRRLTLLLRFALASLVAVAALGLSVSYVAGRSIESASLDSARLSAYAGLNTRIQRHLRPQDLQHPMVDGPRYRWFTNFVNQSILSDRTVRVKIWNAKGTVIYSSDRQIVGRTFPLSDELRSALTGKLASEVSNLQGAENVDDRKFGRLLEVYVPIRFHSGGPVVGAYEVYQLYAPVARQIETLNRDIDVALIIGLVVLYVLLFGIVRRGSLTITSQQRQLRRYTQDLEDSYSQTISSLAAAVDARDHTTVEHSTRVTELSLALGRWLGMSETDMRSLEQGALLHDVGKIGVSDSILLKPGQLTDEEWLSMRRHPQIGYDMLHDVAFLQAALPIVLYHHERWDGTGYPHGLKGNEIPSAARLFAVIDAYDAITSDRPYRMGAPHEEAMQRIQKDAGTHFDPAMTAAFDDMMTWRLRTDLRRDKRAGRLRARGA